MPNLKIHSEMSRLRTGRRFEELHRWIDEYQEKLGSEHRQKRHYWSEEIYKEIKRKWNNRKDGLGKIATEEWLFHIVIDNLSTLFKITKKHHPMSDYNNFFVFGFHDNGFISYASGNIQNQEQLQLFISKLEEIVHVDFKKEDFEN